MITKEDFLEEKTKLELMIETEKSTLERMTKEIVLNVNKISAALQWVTAEITKFPPEPEPKKKGLFKK